MAGILGRLKRERDSQYSLHSHLPDVKMVALRRLLVPIPPSSPARVTYESDFDYCTAYFAVAICSVASGRCPERRAAAAQYHFCA